MSTTVLKEFRKVVRKFENLPALYSKDKNDHFKAITYRELYKLLSTFGAGLTEIGVKRQDHVGILSDNRKEWLIADMAIMGLGAADVPRGSDSTTEEFLYILNHAECPVTLVENEVQLEKVLTIKEKLPHLKGIIVMDENFEKKENPSGTLEIYTFEEIMQKGREILKKDAHAFEKEIDMGKEQDRATLIYTSGTTGEPKGVILTHTNFCHQMYAPLSHLDIVPGDTALSVLPIWHSFERSVEYVVLFAGSGIAYSRPLAKIMLSDFQAVNPTLFPSVPRIWEAIQTAVYRNVNASGGIKKALFNFFLAVGTGHSKLKNLFMGRLPQFKSRIRILDILISLVPLIILTPFKFLGNLLVFNTIKKKLGIRFKFGISGAGALPPHVDQFFSAVGIKILEGYGLTEAAPIISVRKYKSPVIETIGPPIPQVEAKIITDDGKIAAPGQKGVLHVKGPNIMTGYYKKPEETAKILSDDGWLNTGDLMVQTKKGELKYMGRVKETIVLAGGENIEPGPIEDTVLQSPLIDNIMIVGHDKRFLGALVVPNLENLNQAATTKGLPQKSSEEIVEDTQYHKIINDEINAYVNLKKGFKQFERINKFKLITKPFEPGYELTHSLKMRRGVISEIYKKDIEKIYA